ncbi:hypothetical protein SAMN02745911_1288 [Aureimonas altamirensis DSM 21988]|uniref:DUF1289 domain-containing protein n=1 Tax=Aureimonas altamirensis DSM 21988 TaxID=1121026 RepID=A0ABY1ICK6_9HYPH|nr:DUF1289 domain-containing protein [Aureimonas altamirensis]SHI97524.1 hypothetical protein SAMN02745911_1288 [Aureimonas altamirensis DSM 21988]
MPKVPSPCTEQCLYDPRNRWCSGCGRTREEIRTWQKLTPFRRTALQSELRRRLNRLATREGTE